MNERLTRDELEIERAYKRIDALEAEQEHGRHGGTIDDLWDARARVDELEAEVERLTVERDDLRQRGGYRALIDTQEAVIGEQRDRIRDLEAEVERLRARIEGEVAEFNAGYEACRAGLSVDDEPEETPHGQWCCGYAWAAFDDLQAQVELLREVQRWIPVTEWLPELDTVVEVVAVCVDGSRIVKTDKCLGDGRWLREVFGFRNTHWRPFPPLPEEVSE